MNKPQWPRWAYAVGFLICVVALILVSCWPVSAQASWDLLGFGEIAKAGAQATAAVADATWKTVAIEAIKSAKFLVLLETVVIGLIVIASRFMRLLDRFGQDNVYTWFEIAASCVVVFLITPVAMLLVVIGYKLMEIVL